MVVDAYLGAINPSGRAKAHAVPEGVDKDKNDARVVGGPVCVVWIGERQSAVDLKGICELRTCVGIGVGVLTNNANAMTVAPATRVTFRPTLSMMSISKTVHPVFKVLSIPPASRDTRWLKPRALNRAGR
jgi:hypothetical protein